MAGRGSALAAAGGSPGGRQHLGPHHRGVRRGGRLARRCARGGRGRRGERELSQPRRSAAHVRPLGRSHRRRGDGRRRLPASPLGEVEPGGVRSRRHRRGRPRRRRRSGDARQHGARDGDRCRAAPTRARQRRRRAVGAGHPPDRRARRVRRARRAAAPPDHRGRRRALRRDGRGADARRRVRDPSRHSHLRRPARPAKVLLALERWCRGHQVERVASLVGAAHHRDEEEGTP